MSRNYAKENQWLKTKYVRFESKLDAEVYATIISEIKDTIGANSFMREAIELYKTKPEYFKKIKKD